MEVNNLLSTAVHQKTMSARVSHNKQTSTCCYKIDPRLLPYVVTVYSTALHLHCIQAK